MTNGSLNGARTPPHDEQAEQAMLGLAMALGRIPQAAAALAPGDFYQPRNESIWAAVRTLAEHNKPCDMVSVRAHLQERGKLNGQGVPDLYLLELLQTPPAIEAGHVADIIRDRARRRQIIELHTRALQRAYESTDDAEAQLKKAEEELQRIPRHERAEAEHQFIPGGSFILDTDPTPRPLWGDGDQVLWADGEALIIAGAQGAGKTTLAQQVVLGWAGFPGYAELLGYPIEEGRRVLYLAMDRPRQAARSFRRMVDDSQRAELDDRVVVWKGPPPGDLAKHPSLLLHLCDKAYADAVVVDSIKDAAVGLSDDEVGAGYNRSRQTAIAAGVQVLELHHIRKALSGAKAEHPGIDDVYGSTWITSGAGSVILLNGKPGDPIVTFHHLKQPSAEVGPYKVLHNDVTGRSTIWHGVDLIALVKARGSISAIDAAEALFDTESPTAAEKERARRRLDSLVNKGQLWVVDSGDVATKRPKLWAAK